MNKNNLREKLADLEHKQWCHWTEYMLENLFGAVTIEKKIENIQRWRKQIKIPYSKLTEKEKDSDREWADKSLVLFREVIEKQIKTQEGFLKDDFEDDKAIKWRIIGFKELLKQLK